MSFQAVAWAMKQELPPLPKFVLVALCERANPDNGQCWPGVKTLAAAVCLSERSVVTYIAALVRNGFVMRQAMRGKDGRKRTNHYWVLFDRVPAAWIGPGGKVEEMPADSEDEESAVEDAVPPESPPHANPAPGHHTQTGAHGPHAPACVRYIELEPPVIEPSESEILDRAPELPAPAPHSFDPNARRRELDRLKAAEEARRPKRLPVIQGSAPWLAWVKHGHPSDLVGTIEINGRIDRGWYFETLWPKETGPPAADLLEQSQAPPAKKAG
jgi:helix-turn-helix protein